MKTHKLKILPEFYKAVYDGSKRFECRKADRDFKVGDRLIMEEAPEPLCGTGRKVMATVTFVLPGGQFGIDPEWCVLGIDAFISSREAEE